MRGDLARVARRSVHRRFSPEMPREHTRYIEQTGQDSASRISLLALRILHFPQLPHCPGGRDLPGLFPHRTRGGD
jgi:hypothetical protein